MSVQTVQHTIRGIPKSVDKALRSQSKQGGNSLNQTAIEALARGLGVSEQPVVHHDLDKLAGTWEEDPAFDKALADQDRVDPSLWK
jgi:hypothetical protein